MKMIPQPGYTVSDVVGICVQHIEDAALVARANAALTRFNSDELDYRAKGIATDLYKIVESDQMLGYLSKNDLSFLYGKLSSQTPATRVIYDHIRGLAKGMICPLCNQRIVSTLDHYLAKSFHGAYSITPLNLVPACKDCNTDSGVRRATSPGTQTAHPYFDNLDDEVWLEARIVEQSPPTAEFYVANPAAWTTDKCEMAETHFDAFGLSKLYSAQAGQELVNIYVDLVNSSAILTIEDRRQHFIETSTRRRSPFKNSWQAALYLAAAKSNWFCDDGYLELSQSELFT